MEQFLIEKNREVLQKTPLRLRYEKDPSIDELWGVFVNECSIAHQITSSEGIDAIIKNCKEGEAGSSLSGQFFFGFK